MKKLSIFIFLFTLFLAIFDIISDGISILGFYRSKDIKSFGSLLGVYAAYFFISVGCVVRHCSLIHQVGSGPFSFAFISLMCILSPEVLLFLAENENETIPITTHILVLVGEIIQDGFGLGININALYTIKDIAEVNGSTYYILLSVITSILSLVCRGLYVWILFLVDYWSNEITSLSNKHTGKRFSALLPVLILYIVTNVWIIVIIGIRYSDLTDKYKTVVIIFATLTSVFRLLHFSISFVVEMEESIKQSGSLVGFLVVLFTLLAPVPLLLDEGLGLFAFSLFTEILFFFIPSIIVLSTILEYETSIYGIFILSIFVTIFMGITLLMTFLYSSISRNGNSKSHVLGWPTSVFIFVDALIRMVLVVLLIVLGIKTTYPGNFHNVIIGVMAIVVLWRIWAIIPAWSLVFNTYELLSPIAFGAVMLFGPTLL